MNLVLHGVEQSLPNLFVLFRAIEIPGLKGLISLSSFWVALAEVRSFFNPLRIHACHGPVLLDGS